MTFYAGNLIDFTKKSVAYLGTNNAQSQKEIRGKSQLQYKNNF